MKANTRTNQLIKLAHPAIPESAIQRAVDVLRSGALVQGTYVQEFEAALCEYLDVEHAVVVSSGTAALHLALLVSNIGPGDEVIVPAFTFPATANAVVLTGARPVLVDISLDDFNIDPALVEPAITHRTRAIIPVHEFGLPSNMQAIREIAFKNNLTIVEDAACALGADTVGSKVGAAGNLACFSFHPRKAITTGEGGVVATNDPDTADRLRSLRNHGITNINGRMDIAEAAPNYRMTDFQAALATDQLTTLEAQIEIRQAQAQLYDSLLIDNPDVSVPMTFTDRRQVYQTYHVLIHENVDRNNLIASMRKRGVETNFGAWALNLLSAYESQLGNRRDSFPNAVRAFHSGLALPIGSHITTEQVRTIVEMLAACLEDIAAPV